MDGRRKKIELQLPSIDVHYPSNTMQTRGKLIRTLSHTKWLIANDFLLHLAYIFSSVGRQCGRLQQAEWFAFQYSIKNGSINKAEEKKL